MIEIPASAVDFDDCEYSDAQELLYGGEPFTGAVVERGPQGQIVTLQWFRFGIPDGISRIWSHEGQLRQEIDYAFGLPKFRKEWHANGQLALEMVFDSLAQVTHKAAWDEAGKPTKMPWER